jgi:hydroxypyruvate isomerase
MLQLSAHLSLLYPELPFLARFAAAVADGFEAVEFWEPERPEAVAQEVAALGIGVTLVNVPPGEPAGSGRMADQASIPWWREQFLRTAAFAAKIGCPAINVLAGTRNADPVRQDHVMLENLGWAADQLAGTPIRLLLEHLNGHDRPGYLLPTLEDAVALRARTGAAERIGVLFDAYHAARAGADPAACFLAHQEAIAHVQIADAPGRHEPGTGTTDFAALFAALREGGYSGWVGLEYEPSCGHGAALRWRADCA